MQNYLFYGAVLFAGFGLTWILGGAWQRSLHSKRYRELEVRLKEGEKRFLSLAGELGTAKQQLSILSRELDQSRQAQTQLTYQNREKILKRSLQSAFAGALAGLLLGSMMAAVITDARGQVRLMEKTVSLEVAARTAEARSESLRAELSALRDEYQGFRRNMMGVQESRAIAVTKLEMLLDQLSARKLRGGLEMDLKAMREGLDGQRSMENLSTHEILALASSKAS